MPNRSIVHAIAVAGGVTAGTLPVGLDVSALMAEEVAMVVSIGKAFGVSVDKTMAKGILTACGCTAVGTAIFTAVNIGYPFTIPAKITIAAGVIETAGNLVYNYFEKNYGSDTGYDGKELPDKNITSVCEKPVEKTSQVCCEMGTAPRV